jgi:hypothetical protein
MQRARRGRATGEQHLVWRDDVQWVESIEQHNLGEHRHSHPSPVRGRFVAPILADAIDPSTLLGSGGIAIDRRILATHHFGASVADHQCGWRVW